MLTVFGYRQFIVHQEPLQLKRGSSYPVRLADQVLSIDVGVVVRQGKVPIILQQVVIDINKLVWVLKKNGNEN
jgi:hypothetical protein